LTEVVKTAPYLCPDNAARALSGLFLYGQMSVRIDESVVTSSSAEAQINNPLASLTLKYQDFMMVFINPEFDPKTKKQLKRLLNLMFLFVAIVIIVLLFSLEY
jgi:hypothetical protein